ncbi:MAG: SDR family oxidoreductase [Gammaproteobacteria bacterium]|nr:SDR family oxidoreductase [Gammaproteobacteria bacterium]
MPIIRKLFSLLTILGTLLWAQLEPVIAAESAAMPTVLITGANRGIGIEFAKQYAQRGWLVIASCRNPDSAKDLQALQRNYANLQLVQIDLINSAGIDQFAQSLNGKPIDVLINNAALLGDLKNQMFGQIDYEQFAQILAVNTIGTMKLSESLTPNIKLGTQKKIITLGSSAGSIASINGNPDLYAYRASKAALHLLMRNLSFELADDGIVVGLINPGLVDTRGFAAMLDGTAPTPPKFQKIVNLIKAGVIQLTTPETAVTDMITLIDELTPEQSGVFLNADGTPLPW